MSILERAVGDLADALDTLEAKISDRLAQENSGGDDAAAIRKHVRAARTRADEAGEELSAVIAELKQLVEEDGN